MICYRSQSSEPDHLFFLNVCFVEIYTVSCVTLVSELFKGHSDWLSLVNKMGSTSWDLYAMVCTSCAMSRAYSQLCLLGLPMKIKSLDEEKSVLPSGFHSHCSAMFKAGSYSASLVCRVLFMGSCLHSFIKAEKYLKEPWKRLQ